MSIEKKKITLILVRVILDTIFLFGIGLGRFLAIGVGLGLIATVMYQPWFDAHFEVLVDKHFKHLSHRRRVLYGLYFGSQWPSAVVLWFYEHVFGDEILDNDPAEPTAKTDEEKKS